MRMWSATILRYLREAKRPASQHALWITSVYLVVAGAWAVVSTAVVSLLLPGAELIRIWALGGWVYVLATAFLIHFLCYRHMLQLQELSLALDRRRGQLQALLRVLPDLAFRLTREGRILSYHAPSENMLALPPDIFLGKKLSDVFPPQIAEPALQAIRKCLVSRAPVQFEYTIRLMRGEERTFEARLTPVDATSVLALCRDVTETRRAEAERSRLAAAVEQAVEGIAISDKEGRIIYCNSGFEKVIGRKRDALLGRSIHAFKDEFRWELSPPDVGACLQSGKAWQGRITLLLEGGQQRQIHGSISPLRDESGNITNFVALLRDVTYEVNLERRFLQFQKMESVVRLAAGIAHDFNNMLTTIAGLAEEILERPELPQRVKEDAGNILQAAQSGSRLSRQLMAMSKPEVIQPQPVSLDQITRNMVQLLQRTLGSHIQLRHEPNSADATVEADITQIEQVIMNLALNARDAMPQGGELLIRTEQISIGPDDMRSQLGIQPGKYVVLTVRDTGTGMTPEVKERAFEPFFTTKKETGTGLGLATVYAITRRHRGYVELDSTPGSGTEVRIYLPCLSPAPEAQSERQAGSYEQPAAPPP